MQSPEMRRTSFGHNNYEGQKPWVENAECLRTNIVNWARIRAAAPTAAKWRYADGKVAKLTARLWELDGEEGENG